MATIASLLADRVTLEVRSVDRIFVAGYRPRLQTEGWSCASCWTAASRSRRRPRWARSARRIGRRSTASRTRNQIPVVHFAKGACKEDVARPYLQAAEREGRFGVVMIGVAQEKLVAWKGYARAARRRTRTSAIGACRRSRTTTTSTCATREWGPAFIKTVAYAPYPVWLCLNGHEWAKRQASQARARVRVARQRLSRDRRRRPRWPRSAASLSERDIERFFARWEARLPSPFTAEDRLRGYRYALSLRQLEISDTRVFDQPGRRPRVV